MQSEVLWVSGLFKPTELHSFLHWTKHRWDCWNQLCSGGVDWRKQSCWCFHSNWWNPSWTFSWLGTAIVWWVCVHTWDSQAFLKMAHEAVFGNSSHVQPDFSKSWFLNQLDRFAGFWLCRWREQFPLIVTLFLDKTVWIWQGRNTICETGVLLKTSKWARKYGGSITNMKSLHPDFSTKAPFPPFTRAPKPTVKTGSFLGFLWISSQSQISSEAYQIIGDGSDKFYRNNLSIWRNLTWSLVDVWILVSRLMSPPEEFSRIWGLTMAHERIEPFESKRLSSWNEKCASHNWAQSPGEWLYWGKQGASHNMDEELGHISSVKVRTRGGWQHRVKFFD